MIIQLLFVKFLALPAPQDAGSVFPGPEGPILDGNSPGYSPSVCAGNDADAERGDVPAQPVADQQQLVLADPKPEVDDDMPLAALVQVSCEQPVALSNDDVVMSPGPHDPSATSAVLCLRLRWTIFNLLWKKMQMRTLTRAHRHLQC